MSAEDISICSMCQMPFDSHKEAVGHKCIEIKEEKIELGGTISDEKDFKDGCDLSENDSDYTPSIKKSKMKQGESNEKFKHDVKKRKGNTRNDIKLKIETNESKDKKQISSTISSSLELSEQFILFILKQVDEICENVKNGDPDTKRSKEVNHNLNNAVISYRNMLDFEKELFDESEYYDDIGIESENEYDSTDIFHDSKVPEKKVKEPKVSKKCPICDASFSSQMVQSTVNRHINKCKQEYKVGPIVKDNDQELSEIDPLEVVFPVSKVPEINLKKQKVSKKNLEKSKVPKKKGRKLKAPEEKRKMGPKNIKHDEEFILVKNQCGRHKLSEMSLLLGMNMSTLRSRIKREGITFSKKLLECELCEMKKNTIDIMKYPLITMITYNSVEKKFECCICKFSGSFRGIMHRHLIEKHRNEINAKALLDAKSENNPHCEESLCPKVYGNGRGKKFWCKKCSKKEEKRKKESKPVCPECGLTVKCLKDHLIRKHSQEKHICNICSQEYPSLIHLKVK